MAAEQAKRNESADQSELELQASELNSKMERLKGELADFQAYDIERYRQLQKKEQGLKQETNDFTDNIFAVKKWMLKVNPQLSDADISRMFEIPDDFDNI